MKVRKSLVWYVKNPEDLNVESIVEHTLNYGDWDDVQELIKILGMNQVAEIFTRQISGRRTNYSPKIAHYFSLYLKAHA